MLKITASILRLYIISAITLHIADCAAMSLKNKIFAAVTTATIGRLSWQCWKIHNEKLQQKIKAEAAKQQKIRAEAESAKRQEMAEDARWQREMDASMARMAELAAFTPQWHDQNQRKN